MRRSSSSTTPKFAAATRELKVGPGLDDGVVQGPLIDEKALEMMEGFLADATSRGGRVVTGGNRLDLRGTFFAPTVVADATQDMRFAREEIFGPVAPIFRFDTVDDAVRMANDTEFGLACYFYTGSLKRAIRVSEQLKYGIVGLNEGLVTTEVAPFGGFNQSGLGREGSKYGLDDYLETKYVCVGGLAD